MAKRRCKLRTKMWENVTQAQRAFNGQAPDGKGGYIRKQDRKNEAYRAVTYKAITSIIAEVAANPPVTVTAPEIRILEHRRVPIATAKVMNEITDEMNREQPGSMDPHDSACVCSACGCWFVLGPAVPLPRCCPKCKSPHWQSERVIENYPAQEGVKGCACQERSFLEKVVREG